MVCARSKGWVLYLLDKLRARWFIELIDGQSLAEGRYMERWLKSYFNAISKSSIMSFGIYSYRQPNCINLL